MKIIFIILITTLLYANELQIKAKSFESDQSKGISTFLGDVNILKGGDELNASKVIIYTDEDNKPIKFVAEGNVSFIIETQKGEKYSGVSQKAIYKPLSKEYYFYDNVHITQLGEKNKIIGDEVIIKTIEGKAKAKSKTDKPVIMIFDLKEDDK